MDRSIFWARLLGLYAVILCAGILYQIKSYQAIIVTLTKNPAEVMLMGIFTVFLGLAIIVSHSVWRGWPIIITLLGYWITFKGIILTFFPVWVDVVMQYWAKYTYYGPIPALVIGIILLYCGFCRHENL